jgi:general secretion pathway protein B
MSYILEALRKSERERQTGQVPSLPALLSDQPPRRRHGVLWLIVLLLAVNGAGLGYLWLNGWGRNPPPVQSASPEPTHPADSEAKTAASTDVGPNNTITLTGPPPANLPPKAVESAPSVAAKPLPPQRSEAKAGTAANPFPAPPSSRTAKPAPAVKPIARQPTVARVDRAPEEEESTKRLPSVASLKREERLAALQAPVPAFVPRVPDTDTETDAQEPDRAEQDAIPWLSTLPANFQQRVPPIKINIFAYSKVPAERFAIIDMRKYLVGDRIPGGAALLEIRSDSLVLELDGAKFRIPRP